MKFVSWNVNGIRACVQKGFLDFFRRQMQIFSVFRRRRCRRGSLPLRRQGITNIGITPSGKAIQERQSLRRRSRCLFLMESG